MQGCNLQAISVRVEAVIMSRVVLWNTAGNFNAVILNQSIFDRLITSASTLYHELNPTLHFFNMNMALSLIT